MLYVVGIFSLIMLVLRLVAYTRRQREQQSRTLHLPGSFFTHDEPERDPDDETDDEQDDNAPGTVREFAVSGSGPYRIEYHENSINGERLLNGAGEPVFDRTFTNIIHNHGSGYSPESNFYICRYRGGSLVFDMAAGKAWDTSFNRISIDDFNNRLFRRREQYGILDEHFRPANNKRYPYLTGVAPGYFTALQDGRRHLVDAEGIVLLEGVRSVANEAIEGEVLIHLDDGRYFLLSIKERIFRELLYDSVLPAHNFLSSGPHKDTRFYIATRETGEHYKDTDLKREKNTVLNSSGEILFGGDYEAIQSMRMGDRFLFIVSSGMGFRYWNYRVDRATAAGEELEGSMLMGLVDEKGNVLIPSVYNMLDPVGETGLFIVNKGGKAIIMEEHDEDYDENYFSWDIRGGHFGIINLKGEEVIPLGNAFVAEEYDAAAAVLRIKVQRTADSDPEYFDRSNLSRIDASS